MKWKVCSGNTLKGWIGIIETNWQWAYPYWTKRGFKLIMVN